MPDPVLIPAILSLSFSGVIGIISQIQHSRCTEINCLGVHVLDEFHQNQTNINQKLT